MSGIALLFGPVLNILDQAGVYLSRSTFHNIWSMNITEFIWKMTTTTLKKVGQPAPVGVSLKEDARAPGLSEEQPGGEEVKEKEEQEKTSKLMWEPQKADPNDLDDIVITLKHHGAIGATPFHRKTWI